MSETPNRHPLLAEHGGGYENLARFLEEHEAQIVGDWVSVVATRVASESVSRSTLENSVRQVLLHLRERLIGGPSRRSVSAEQHGEQRFRIGFHLMSVMSEYALLLDVIEKVALDVNFELQAAEIRALSRHVARGVADSVSTFVAEQHAERIALVNRHFAFIAHELRNSAQSVELAAQVLKKSPNHDRAMEVLDRSLAGLQSMIDETLTQARKDALEGDILVAKPQEFDLVAVARDLIEATSGAAEARGMSLVLEAPPSASVRLDRTLTWSLLSNLVRNGIKFSCDGGVVTLRVSCDDDVVGLEVEDRCGGLPDGAKQKMFEPFAQLIGDDRGFGLGLAITRQAVDAQRGRIQVHDVDDGCVFVVELPRRLEDNAADAS